MVAASEAMSFSDAGAFVCVVECAATVSLTGSDAGERAAGEVVRAKLWFVLRAEDKKRERRKGALEVFDPRMGG